ncbi:AtpZ/AtpI family protein [Nocardioides sp. KIGAM211]|uniref:AtpZ/AtpI family protein n=1 Tax=Nocardioides luti TaxID=2761101 RepID=A0A7X0VBX7_9ACTN|nr:AtpZ/AtpI family protein [Nocardioides luti]MBB6629204.1 AtpZ/AtpI family protein [Nocardioides luti]
MVDESSPNGLRGRDLIGLGGLLVGAVVAGLVLGLVVDDRAGTAPTFALVGIALGILAGGLGFVARVRAALRD